MRICDLCEGRVDVHQCRIELPLIRDASGLLDLCMKCQQKVFTTLESFASNKTSIDPMSPETPGQSIPKKKGSPK